MWYQGNFSRTWNKEILNVSIQIIPSIFASNGTAFWLLWSLVPTSMVQDTGRLGPGTAHVVLWYILPVIILKLRLNELDENIYISEVNKLSVQNSRFSFPNCLNIDLK